MNLVDALLFNGLLVFKVIRCLYNILFNSRATFLFLFLFCSGQQCLCSVSFWIFPRCRCAQDTSITHNYRLDNKQQFSIEAFRCIKPKSLPTLWAACLVNTTTITTAIAIAAIIKEETTSLNKTWSFSLKLSRCVQGCVRNKRKRREAGIDRGSEGTSAHKVTAGPIALNKDQNNNAGSKHMNIESNGKHSGFNVLNKRLIDIIMRTSKKVCMGIFRGSFSSFKIFYQDAQQTVKFLVRRCC